jgi:hypothetical protein
MNGAHARLDNQNTTEHLLKIEKYLFVLLNNNFLPLGLDNHRSRFGMRLPVVLPEIKIQNKLPSSNILRKHTFA